MHLNLLTNARLQAKNADPSIAAAALLRIARAELASDPSGAHKTLLEGLDAIEALPSNLRDHLFQESRSVAAAISPELLDKIPVVRRDSPHERFESAQVVQAMIAYGHVDAAFNYLLRHDAPFFPFLSVSGVLHKLGQPGAEFGDRRMLLLRHAVTMWSKGAVSRNDRHGRDQFVLLSLGITRRSFRSRKRSQ